jgi:hypothetical protein
MDRRAFLEKILAGLVLGGAFLAGGCAKKEEKVARFGNQGKLWNIATGQAKAEEPLALAHAKDTPAFYRDASLGKVDPSFTPKVGGG